MAEKQNTPHPPRWATRFLHWYCKPHLLEDLEGDLYEYFQRNIKAKGIYKARILYILDVLKFIRPYTIRKPKLINYLIHWLMLGTYLKTSGRTIVRNKLFSAINIVGLAISMAIGLIMIAILLDITAYDRFHEHHSRIYRLVSKYEYLGNQDNNYMATTSMTAAQLVKEDFTMPAGVAILTRNFGGDFEYADKYIPLHGFWTNPELLTVFSFQLLEGNPATALTEPYSIVLTETSARKLFGDEQGLGKTITLNKEKTYTVTGILKDVPALSHMKFDILGSLSTRALDEEQTKRDAAWDNIWNTWAYMLMPEGADLESFKEQLDKLSEREDKTVKNTHIELALQPLADIMTGESMGNQIGPTMGGTMLWSFLGLTFVVILSACFNYTNLSVARSLRRSREVGIRKVIGALKIHVVGQFVMEAVVISLLALVFSILLFVFIRPHFLSLEPELQQIFVLEISPTLILSFIGFAVFIGVVAGLFPALFFARINTIQVLKDSTSSLFFRKLTLRKALIVFQYCISLIMITATAILFSQYKHFLNYDLGFTTENILNIRLQGGKPELLKKALLELPEVQGISQSDMVMSVGNYWGTTMINPNDPLDSANIYFNRVDEHYIPLHDHVMLSGKNFTYRPSDSPEDQVIVTPRVLKRFSISPDDPSKAIGEVVRIDKKELVIIGVIEDFEYGQVNNNTNREVVFRHSSTDADFLNVKITSTDIQKTMKAIDVLWKEFDPVHPLDARFHADELEAAFSGMKAAIKLSGTIAFLAIFIASLGLLGMVVFTLETRLKEISIRKVLGASEATLLVLLSKGFIFLLALAAMIALPVTYLFFHNFLLEQVANKAPITFMEMSIGVVVVFFIALLLILSQTIKVARTNPAAVLKTE